MSNRIVPMVAYEDAAEAIEWLSRAFGFRENVEERYTDSDGVVGHAELVYADDTVMVATPSADYRSPNHHRETCQEAARWLDNPWVSNGVFIRVDDIDAHYAQAKEAGANVIRPLDDSGVGFRLYTAEDLEGHRWMFAG